MNQLQTRKIGTRLCGSETEDYTSDQSYNKAFTSEGTPDSQYATSNGQINRSNPEDSDLAGIVASIESDLSKLKESLCRRDASGKSHVRQSSQHFTTLWAFVVGCFANSKLAIDCGLSPFDLKS